MNRITRKHNREYSDTTYRCCHCEYETKIKKALDLHLKVVHKIDKIKSSGGKYLICFCGDVFFDKRFLDHHKKVCKHFR